MSQYDELKKARMDDVLNIVSPTHTIEKVSETSVRFRLKSNPNQVTINFELRDDGYWDRGIREPYSHDELMRAYFGGHHKSSSPRIGWKTYGPVVDYWKSKCSWCYEVNHRKTMIDGKKFAIPFKNENLDFNKKNMEHIKIPNSDLRDANFYTAGIIDCDFSGSDLRDACFDHAKFNRVDMSNTDLRYASFQRTTFIDVDFTGADMSKTVCYDATFHNCTFTNTVINNAKLRNTTFYDIDLSNVNMCHSNLEDAKLYNSKITKENMHNKNFDGVNFKGACSHEKIFLA
jgi:uncharacterized protein YjbI with pentapeptide repeats